MKKQIFLSTLILSTILTSCSSVRKSVSLGVGTGMTTGLLLGNGDSKKTKTGLAIGAVVGGIASYFIHKGIEKRDTETRKETLFNLDKFGTYGRIKTSTSNNSAPFSLTPAQVEEEFIETHVEDGRRLIEAHRVWTISNDSQWIETPKSFNKGKK